ncbi:hypothetical protein [Dongia sp.]|uniref:hypothetical protein n=1 Tax=Dongia sp. TaxID=1977262 RepID=UPI003750A11B
MSKRLAQAVTIRDHVLHLVRKEGKWSEVSGIKVREWERNGFRAFLNTVFNPMPASAPPISTPEEAILYQRASRPQPNQLSVWMGGKVLSVEWADDSTPRIISFRRGEWEQKLLDMA